MSETKALTVTQDIRNNLTRMKPEFKNALPVHINPDRFLRVIMTAIQVSPKIAQGNRASLYAACTKAAQDGLLPDGKEAALVPFGDTIQYMPMYAGILKKFRNSGDCKTIMAQIVYDNDPFKYWVDDQGEHIEHEPLVFGDRGNKKGFYAMAITKDGGAYIEVMTIAQMEKVKNVSRSKDSNSGPWKNWPEEMEKKSVIRRLSKRLPMSSDLEAFIQQNDDMFDVNAEATPIPKDTEPTRTKNLIKESSEVIDVEAKNIDEVPI